MRLCIPSRLIPPWNAAYAWWVRRLGQSCLYAIGLIGLSMDLSGCAARVAGQVELLTVDNHGNLQRYSQAQEVQASRPVLPGENDPIRLNDDVVAIQVESAYIQNLPFRLTGSKDVILFADVWEDAAMGFNSPSSLTTIVYVGPNQKVPGRLNFRDMLAYGPTKFKGHPLRVRFTMMVLQKHAADNSASAIDLINAFAALAAPQYSAISSEVAKLLQGILKAQPDIKFFDFDATFTSDAPEALMDIIPPTPAPRIPAPPEPGLPVPPGTFVPEPSGKPDKIHWLRYGRYALLETESYDGKSFTVANLQASQVSVEDSWLRNPDGKPLATSYVVFRITPRQLDQKNEVLRAASDANFKLLESLRRSDTEISSAFEQIETSAMNLQNEVLRVRAEALAHKIVRNAENQKPGSGKEALEKEFSLKWNDQIKFITDKNRKRQIEMIGNDVKNRWLAKYGAPPAAGRA
jgi:hypothetical protein